MLAIAFAFDVIMSIALRSYSYKCIAEIVASCFACFALASSPWAYNTTTIATLNTKLTTCVNGFGLICTYNNNITGPGVFVTSWPNIRRSLVISPSNLFTTRFGQLCHPQRGGAYPPRTRLRGDQRGEGHVKVARVFRDVRRRHLASSGEQGRTSRRW